MVSNIYNKCFRLNSYLRTFSCFNQRKGNVVLPRCVETDNGKTNLNEVHDHETCLKSKNQSILGLSYSNVDFNETDYYFHNGLRKVYPYYYRYKTFCKGRWVGKKLFDVYSKEFSLLNDEEYEKRIVSGALKVNGEKAPLDYILKHSDYLTSNVHRHELPILSAPINIIFEDDDLLVIDKPPSVSVHPCGLYRHNTAMFILAKEHNLRGLRVVHRLDRLTSGLLIFSKTMQKAQDLHQDMVLRAVTKQYICRVEGKFPDGIVICDKPLKRFYNKIGISMVNPLGKHSVTEFQNLHYNGQSSVVLCKPLTGRTHQIRVHLQYLGHPIVNDPLYNSDVFGPEKGKHGIIGKTIECLLNDLIELHKKIKWLDAHPRVTDDFETSTHTLSKSIHVPHLHNDKKMLNDQVTEPSISKFSKDHKNYTYDPECYSCQNSFRDPSQSELIIYLHAFKYSGKNWKFQTDMPAWASDNWIEN